MAPLGRAGWKNASSSVGAEFCSLFTVSARVSANKNLERRPAHSVVFVLPISMIPTSKAYPVSNRLIVECLVTAWNTRT